MEPVLPFEIELQQEFFMAQGRVDSNQEASRDRLDMKKILPVFMIVVIDLLGLTIIIPLMPLYAASFGANPFMIGLLGAAYPITQFVGAPLLGRFSDRWGRRPVLLISQIGTLIGFLVLGFSDALWLLFLARMIDGISGANIATAQAVISDVTNEKTRTQGLGLIGAAFGIGFVIGPVLAFIALALSGNNYHVPAFVAAAFSAASIAMTWFLLPETHPEHSEYKGDGGEKSLTLQAMLRAIRLPQIGVLLGLIFMQQIAFGGFEQLLSLFTLERLGLNASGNAVIFVFVGVLVVAVQGGLIGPWSRRWGDRRLVFLGLLTLAIGLVLISFTPREPVPWYSQQELTQELQSSGSFRTHENPTTQHVGVTLPSDQKTGWYGLGWILVAMIPTAIGGGILQPSINSMLTKRVTTGEIGGILGISSALLSGANAVAPIVGGALFDLFGATVPFLVFGLIMAALFIGALRLIRPAAEP
ncbi:MAG: MFS transporter [Anaerolineales bacterium]|jgi:MFS family permease